MGTVGESRIWLTCTHKGDGGFFLWNLFDFLFLSTMVKIFDGLYHFLDAHQSTMVTLHAYALHKNTPPV